MSSSNYLILQRRRKQQQSYQRKLEESRLNQQAELDADIANHRNHSTKKKQKQEQQQRGIDSFNSPFVTLQVSSTKNSTTTTSKEDDLAFMKKPRSDKSCLDGSPSGLPSRRIRRIPEITSKACKREATLSTGDGGDDIDCWIKSNKKNTTTSSSRPSKQISSDKKLIDKSPKLICSSRATASLCKEMKEGRKQQVAESGANTCAIESPSDDGNLKDNNDDNSSESSDGSFDLLAEFQRTQSQIHHHPTPPKNILLRTSHREVSKIDDDDVLRTQLNKRPEQNNVEESIDERKSNRKRDFETNEKDNDSINKPTMKKRQQNKCSSKREVLSSPPVSAVVVPNGGGLVLKVITFNVAEFVPHNNAPSGFNPMRAFQEELRQYQPDILMLQEIPIGDESFFLDYKCVGTARSHCSSVGLFVRKDFLREQNASVARLYLSEPFDQKNTMMAKEFPAVFGSLTWEDGREPMIIGSCHLEPFKEGAPMRLAQLEAISKVTATKGSRMIIAGDMNMRSAEDNAAEKVGNWMDAWKEGGCIKKEHFTWNSKSNKYHAKGFEFTCRFDRVYVRNIQRVQSFKLMANEPMINPTKARGNDGNNNRYYLSDHFGIVTTIVL